jgi:uncharacterized protein (DUF885 family)
MNQSTRRQIGLLAVCLLSASTAGAGDAARDLHALFDGAWERDLREDPIHASRLGDHRYDALWPDDSPGTLEKQAADDRSLIAAVKAVPASELTSEDRLNQDLFERYYGDRVAAYDYGAQYLPMDHKDGVQALDQLVELLPFATAEDYDNWNRRLATIAPLVDQHIALLRQGITRKLVQPRVIIQRVPARVEKQIVDDPTQSGFYRPLVSMPDSIPTAEQARLRIAAQQAIATQVVPAYRRLLAFVNDEYLPACRETVGIWDTPNGVERYAQRIRWHTTTTLPAEEIHALGLREVERIRGEMLAVIDRVGFKGTLPEFLQQLRTEPRFRYRDPQQLFTAYTVMSKRIDPLLPTYFGKLPRMTYGVRPIPDAAAPDTTTAYYESPGIDGKRPGYYFVNLYKPEERPTYEIPALTMHEAVPGHHLQIALAQELTNLPIFRRDLYLTAYVEGWALYSESLGDEMGLYEDPYDKFGQLTYEMWRAVRLVVDTGMHAKHWTRQQAIDYFKANAGKTELDIVNEIDRYIADPGQALAYKIGELKIKELRRASSGKLGAKFDLREFHDVVLGSGPVPLDVLERNVADWQKRRLQ